MAGTKQPSDRSHFILPDLGEGVHEAELIKWRVKPGESVDEHQTLAEMETDKALVEVPSPWAGVVKELHGAEGDIINVGSTLVSYDVAGKSEGASTAPPTDGKQAGGKRTGAAAAKQARPPAEEEAAAAEREDAGTVVGNVSGELTISDRFSRRRREAEDAAASRRKALATPAVRRIAREMGLDINEVPGTGRGGRVTASDIEQYAGKAGAVEVATETTAARSSDVAAFQPPKPSQPLAVSVSTDGVLERVPMRGIRRKIAQALLHSVQTTVHFTVVDEADVTALDQKRKEYTRVLGRKVSLLPFIMLAVIKALRKHPTLNANVDDENEQVLIKRPIHLGCAVDTEHGLMVPVIHDAHEKNLMDLAEAVQHLAQGARSRTIEREQLSGGTFTISNVGSYGGKFATPIINYPEVAILAAGRAYEKVLASNGHIYAGTVLPLSMSCDHRVVDGAEGARFLNSVVGLLEDPALLVG